MQESLEGRDMLIYNKEKLSNLFVYLSSKINNLYSTKLIKLTYLIDEISVSETGVPVTWLSYKVWEKGPVPEKIYYNIVLELGSEFKDFIHITPSKKYSNGFKITPNSAFNDSEFSDYEIELMDRVIEEFGNLSSSELIDYLHKEGSLWHKVVIEKGLEDKFKYTSKTSPYEIPLKDAIKDKSMIGLYDEMFENVKFFSKLEA
jgi:uncharacterized phage-associated protein